MQTFMYVFCSKFETNVKYIWTNVAMQQIDLLIFTTNVTYTQLIRQ